MESNVRRFRRAGDSAVPSAMVVGATFAGGAGKLAGDLRISPGSDRVVVLAHGAGQTRHSWTRSANSLHSRGFTVATFDARGHGDSAWSMNASYELDDLAKDVELVADQVRHLSGGSQPPVLVGASMGGIASLMALANNPLAARALVLVDVTPKVEPLEIARIHRFVNSAPDGYETLEEAARAVSEYNPHRKGSGGADGLRRNLRLSADGRWQWHWDPNFFRDRTHKELERDQTMLEESARSLGVPTLLVRGSDSRFATEEGALLLQRLVPHATVARVQGAGHMVVGDDNDQFGEALESFLEEFETTNR